MPRPDQDVVHCVREARRGSQEAFARLYARFAPMVHAILLGRFGRALADELTQDCFLAAHARLGQLRDEASFGAWLAAIARRIRPAHEPPGRTQDEVDAFEGEGVAPDQALEAERVLRAISGLPEAYRETLLMRLAEGMSGPEIAAATGMTHASVRVNLHRGMARLRAALGLSPQAEEAGR